jgi:hypothetical protein
VSAKVNDSKLPKPVKGIVAGRAAMVASKIMKPSEIAKKRGQKICKKIPKKMKEKGFTVEMKEVFREGVKVSMSFNSCRKKRGYHSSIVEKAQREENIDLAQDDDTQSTVVL